MIKVALFNIKLRWNRLVRKFKKYRIESKLNSKSKRDKIAIGLASHYKPGRVCCGVDSISSERLDEGKVTSLGLEVDPLEGVEKIQPDSVNSIKADIPTSSDCKKVVFEDNRANRTKRRRS